MTNINAHFEERITKFDKNLVPSNFNGDASILRNIQDKASVIIDKLGRDSARVQGLGTVLTTTAKLRKSSDTIYLLKDYSEKNNISNMIGLLRVCRKKLFLHDDNDRMHAVDMLCIQDFYIESNKQRNGFGQEIFNYMLQDQGAVPGHLAIDSPTMPMTNFLKNKYGIQNLKLHANNIAVCPEIFTALKDINKVACSTSGSSVTGAGRYTATRTRTHIGHVIHDNSPELRAKPRPRSPNPIL